MSTILNLSQVIKRFKDLRDAKNINLTFDFKLDETNGIIGAIFRACDDIFTLTIKKDRIFITNSDGALIHETVELHEDEEYHVEYGIKLDYTYSYFVLYIRIWQDIKVPQVFYDAFEKQSL